MTDDLAVELERSTNLALAARRSLLELLSKLSATDMARSRRGGWTIRQVLEHIAESDSYYIEGISKLRQLESHGRPTSHKFDSIANATAALEVLSERLEQSLAGIDEESFYKLARLGHQDYSVMAILENSANHDE